MKHYIKTKYLTGKIKEKMKERNEAGLDNPDYNEAIMFVLNIIEKRR